jgi:hypothetical protein
MAAALFFVSVSLSFARDVKVNSKKVPGNAYGHYTKSYDYHPGWYNKQPKPKYNFRNRYGHREVYKDPRHYDYYDRRTPHGSTTIGFKVNEPDYKFLVVVKDHR